jgi:hypothetical protein
MSLPANSAGNYQHRHPKSIDLRKPATKQKTCEFGIDFVFFCTNAPISPITISEAVLEATHMRIGGTIPNELDPLAAGPAEKPDAVQGGQESSAAKVSGQASGYSPSAELLHLTVAAKQQPEARADLVRQVGLRLSQGHYSTPASANQTADAILNAID